ncbi:hypothetical protein GOBAR_DD37004 [Gossypium barbadense]|nr:hypothetical protein GOBAR_DD37004 [Gossypium barbadense]
MAYTKPVQSIVAMPSSGVQTQHPPLHTMYASVHLLEIGEGYVGLCKLLKSVDSRLYHIPTNIGVFSGLP